MDTAKNPTQKPTQDTSQDPVQSSAIILASASSSRADLLAQAGVEVMQMPAQVDESEIKASMKAEGQSASDVAEVLAELKAIRVSQLFPDALVIGADQMLTCQSEWFDKPTDMDHAQAHLLALQGKSHDLITSTCLAQQGRRIWHDQDRATLTMRTLSHSFISFYLNLVGDKALNSVGAYQIEGMGAQLFSQVDGDFFTIRGLCLLPLLEMLRRHGVVPR